MSDRDRFWPVIFLALVVGLLNSITAKSLVVGALALIVVLSVSAIGIVRWLIDSARFK